MSEFTNYYTSADTLVFIEAGRVGAGSVPVLLDKLSHIRFQEGITGRPVYGIGNSIFGFTNIGNNIVSGEISLRFIHPDYMLNAVRSALGNPVVKTKENLTLQQFAKLDPLEVEKIRAEEALSRRLEGSSLMNIPFYFNIRLVFNNGNAYHEDISKSMIIQDVRLLGSGMSSSVAESGPVNRTYKFIARAIGT